MVLSAKQLEIEIKEILHAGLPGIASHQKMVPGKIPSFKSNYNEIKEAAVLVLLYRNNNYWYIPLIQRNEYNGAHSGQVSLPGGKYDLGDNSLEETAKRETFEEIGIQLQNEHALMPISSLTIDVSNFAVKPYIATLEDLPVFKPDKVEVKEIIQLPVNDLLDPKKRVTREMQVRSYNIQCPCFEIMGKIIWGATAMILSEVKDILTQTSIISLQE